MLKKFTLTIAAALILGGCTNTVVDKNYLDLRRRIHNLQ